MKKHFAIVVACMLMCTTLASCTPTVAPEGQTEQRANERLLSRAQEEPVETEKCLTCHPFDEVAEKSKDYVDPVAGPVNPHMATDDNATSNPHESPDAVPMDCNTCHEKNHAIAVDGTALGAELPDNILGCYTSCHHTQTFDACTDCHGSQYYAS